MKKFWISLSFIMVFIVLMLIIILGLVRGIDETEAEIVTNDITNPASFSLMGGPGVFKFLIVMLAVVFAVLILPILMKY